MELSNEELEEVFDILYDHVHYGDDSIVYGPAGDLARAALERVEDEIEKRRRV
jgi:hypothetical protein